MAFKDELNKLHRLALQAIRNGVIIADNQGKIIWVNRAVNQITGYTASELVGSSIEVLEPEDLNLQFEDIWRKARRGASWSGEFPIQRKTGESYFEEMTINPINEDGKVTYFIIIKRDISSRKNIEDNLKQALQSLEHQFDAAERARSETSVVLEATNDSMLLLSMNDKILWVNNRFEEMFMLKEEEVLGQTFTDLLPQFENIFDDPKAIIDRFNHAFSVDDYSYREIATQKWPIKRDLEISSSKVLDSTEVNLGTLFVFRDVTKEREVERLKAEFISLVSHELRTPLGSVSGYIEMVLDGDAGEINEEQKDYLQVAKRNVGKLTKLVSDLLTVSRIEAGALKLQKENLNLTTAIREVVNNLRPQFNMKQQRILVEIPEGEYTIYGDPESIGQIFTNLLSNAHKYTPNDGQISVKMSIEENYYRVDVKDTGMGLTPEDQQKLFTKFFRSRDSEAQQITGVGLGLWITRSLVDIHGGGISLTSEYGKGSTFTVYLPIP